MVSKWDYVLVQNFLNHFLLLHYSSAIKCLICIANPNHLIRRISDCKILIKKSRSVTVLYYLVAIIILLIRLVFIVNKSCLLSTSQLLFNANFYLKYHKLFKIYKIVFDFLEYRKLRLNIYFEVNILFERPKRYFVNCHRFISHSIYNTIT